MSRNYKAGGIVAAFAAIGCIGLSLGWNSGGNISDLIRDPDFRRVISDAELKTLDYDDLKVLYLERIANASVSASAESKRLSGTSSPSRGAATNRNVAAPRTTPRPVDSLQPLPHGERLDVPAYRELFSDEELTTLSDAGFHRELAVRTHSDRLKDEKLTAIFTESELRTLSNDDITRLFTERTAGPTDPRANDHSLFNHNGGGEFDPRVDCNTNGIDDSLELTLGIVSTRPGVNGYVDISGTGTPLNLTDDGAANVTMPFTAAEFLSPQTRISNNGGVAFGVTTGTLATTNTVIPSNTAFGGTAPGRRIIFPYWDDLDADTGNVYHQTIGTTPNQTFIVQWHNRPHFSGDTILDGDECTIQLQIFETPVSGIIAQMYYVDVNFLNAAFDNGISATIGYQRNGTTGVQWSFNVANSVRDGDILSLVAANDCNTNGNLDVCDIAADPTLDCNSNLTIDSCESGFGDCNTNTTNDLCEGRPDCNTNGVPDECELANGATDCNTNQVPDVCERAGNDCNSNQTLDVCDTAGGNNDCNTNGVPDDCETDCNTNDIPDACDIAGMSSGDCNTNQVPDECELTISILTGIPGTFMDISGTGTAINPTDDSEHNISMPFTNALFTSGNLRVGNNGAVGFGVTAGELALTNTAIPSPGAFTTGAQTIFAYWDDLIPAGGNIYTETQGASPNQVYIIQWHNEQHFSSSPSTVTFQVKVFETPLPGAVYAQIIYADTTFGDANDNGASASIGYQDNGTSGIQFAFNQAGSVMAGTVLSIARGSDCNLNNTPDSCDIAGGTSIDCNSNGTPDECEPGGGQDCNTNTQFDNCEPGFTDCDSNGTFDLCDLVSNDCNSNGTVDRCELAGNDCNTNGTPDSCDTAGGNNDCNTDGIPDDCQGGCNTNGVPDACDILGGSSPDCNSNGVPDECEAVDCNNNGTLDSCDILAGAADCNTNQVPDDCELIGQFTGNSGNLSPVVFGTTQTFTLNNAPPAAGDVVLNFFAKADLDLTTEFITVDLNGNGQGDIFVTGAQQCPTGENMATITVPQGTWNGLGSTININMVPSSAVNTGLCADYIRVELAYGSGGDCNTNLTPDVCDIAAGAPDVNGDGIIDACQDCNTNSIPDPSEGLADCNTNVTPDVCEIAAGLADCDSNGVPDVCELVGADCNTNGVPDACDTAGGNNDCNSDGTPDDCQGGCNTNGVPDACDILSGSSMDCDTNGVPDECEGGCNTNGVPDACDLLAGSSSDCNTNGIPDECELGTKVVIGINPVVGFVDISSSPTAVALNLTDDQQVNNTMPFTSQFFPNANAQISNNGAVGFNGTLTLALTNTAIPSAPAFGGAQAVFVYWDDIDADTGNVYVDTQGTAPNRVWIVLWKDRPHFSGDTMLDGNEATFELQIFETPVGGIAAQMFYPDVDFQTPANDFGASASLGYQDNGTTGFQYAFNQAGSVNNGDVLTLLFSTDCNSNGRPDFCDIGDGTSTDCNSNASPDECEPGAGQDCNTNNTPDTCEMPFVDCDRNNTLDVCDLLTNDCNSNGTLDRCELTANDCNTNGTPDACDVAAGATDCNSNSVPDDCEGGCNTNGIPDECETLGGSNDCDTNQVPDECQSGCNTNGVPDACDIAAGSSQDCDSNGVPDECELTISFRTDVAGTFTDISGTGQAYNPTDDSEHNATMPFTTGLFTSGDLRIGNNGAVGFGITTGELGFTNAAIPNAATFLTGGDQVIFAYWDDLIPAGGNLYTETQGTSPNQVFIIQWHNQQHFSSSPETGTFQVKIYQTPLAGGVVAQMIYEDVVFGDANDNGASASIGYQTNGTNGVQYAFNQAGSVTSGTVLSMIFNDYNGNGIPDSCEVLCNCQGDTSTDNFVDGDDIAGFTECLISGTNCTCTDSDNDGTNAGAGDAADDLAAFIDKLLNDADTMCP